MSKVSDHESKADVTAEDMDGDRATSAVASAVPESPLYDVPGEEDELERLKAEIAALKQAVGQ